MTPDDHALLEQHKAAIDAVINGEPIEQIDLITGEWLPLASSPVNIGNPWLRPKPQPSVVPWTEKDQLVGQVVVNKSSGDRRLILGQIYEGVSMIGSLVSYAELLDQYKRLDGSPCGTTEA